MKTATRPRLSWRTEQGFSLAEVALAVAIFTSGVLGMSVLQAVAMRQDQESLVRLRARFLLRDALEMVGASPESFATSYGAPPGSPPDCFAGGTSCAGQQFAQLELAAWKCSLGKWRQNASCPPLLARLWPACADGIPGCAALPEGDGQITEEGNRVTISVRWLMPDSSARQPVYGEMQIQGTRKPPGQGAKQGSLF